MDKLTYSTDTTARIPGADLSPERGYITTGNSTAGYFGGGEILIKSINNGEALLIHQIQLLQFQVPC